MDKIALINCPMWDIEFPPYNIALLLAVLRKNKFEAECFDFNRDFYCFSLDGRHLWSLSNLYSFWQSQREINQLFEKEKKIIDNFIVQLESYNVVGFTLQSLNFVFSIELARRIKKEFPQKILLAGGPECFRNFNPHFLMQSGCFDAICCQEAEISLTALLFKIKNRQPLDITGFFVKKDNAYIDCGFSEPIEDLDALPFADYRFLDIKTEKLSISTSRGCINNCRFCHEKNRWNKFRYRSAESVVKELLLSKKLFPALKFVYFNDSLINGNMRELENFCDFMINNNLGISWGGHTLIRKELTREVLSKMKLAGAERLNFGVESGSDVVLNLMKKSFNHELALRVLEDVKKNRISFSVNLIIGYPGETEEEFSKTVDFYKRIKELTGCIHLNPCYLMKGSEIYDNYNKLGIVLPENYTTDWYLEDGSNNLEIRMQRISELEKINTGE